MARIVGEAGIEITPEEGTFASDLGRELQGDVERAARGVDVPPIEVGLQAVADELRQDVDKKVRAIESTIHADIPLTAQGVVFREQVARAVQQVQDAVHAEIPVEPDELAAFAAKVRGQVADIERVVKAQVPVQPEVDDGALAGVRSKMAARLRLIGQELKLHVGVEIDKDRVKEWASELGSATMTAGRFGVSVLGGAAAASTLGGVLVGLVGIVGQLSGGLVVVPGLLAGVLGIAAGLKIGLSGVGDALGSAFDPSKAQQFNEALSKLAPSAQETVRAVQGLGPAWQAMKLDVQQQLFEGIGQRVATLGNNYLPVLQGGLRQVTAAFGAGAERALDFLNSSAAIGTVRGILDQSAESARRISPAFRDGAEALLTLGGFGAQYLPAIARYIAFLVDSFRDWVVNVGIGQGVLQGWVDGAISTFQQLGDVVRNVASIVGQVWTIAGAGSGGLLGNLVLLTGQLDAFAHSAEGVQLIAGIFGGVSAAAGIFRGILAQLLPALAPIAAQLPGMFAAAEPGLLALAAGAASVLRSAAPLLPVVGTLAGVLGSVLGAALQLAAPLVGFLASALAFLSPVLGPLVAGLAGFAGALAVMVGIGLGVAKMLEVIRVGWLLLNLVFAASPIGFVIALVVGLIAALIYAYQNFEGFRNLVNAVWSGLVSAGQTALDWITGLPGMIGEALSAAGSWFAGLGESALQGVLAVGSFLLGLPGMVVGWLAGLGVAVAVGAAAAWSWLWQSAVQAGQQVLAFLAALPGLIAFGLGFLAGMVFNAAVAAWDFLWNTLPMALAQVAVFLLGLPGMVVGWLASLGAMVASAAGAAWSWLQVQAALAIAQAIAWLVALPGQVTSWLASLGSTVAAGATAAWNWLLSQILLYGGMMLAWLAALPGRVGSFLASLPGVVINAATSAWSGFLSATTRLASSALGFIGSLPGRIIGFFSAAGSWLVNAGRAIVQGLWDGLKSMAQAVLDWIADLGRKVAAGFKAAVGVHSPSTVFAEIGVNLGQGLVIGLDRIAPDVVAAAGRLAASTAAAAQVRIPTAGSLEAGRALDRAGIANADFQVSAGAAGAQITNNIYTREGQSPKQIADETSRLQAFKLDTGTSSLVGAV